MSRKPYDSERVHIESNAWEIAQYVNTRSYAPFLWGAVGDTVIVAARGTYAEELRSMVLRWSERRRGEGMSDDG